MSGMRTGRQAGKQELRGGSKETRLTGRQADRQAVRWTCTDKAGRYTDGQYCAICASYVITISVCMDIASIMGGACKYAHIMKGNVIACVYYIIHCLFFVCMTPSDNYTHSHTRTLPLTSHTHTHTWPTTHHSDVMWTELSSPSRFTYRSHTHNTPAYTHTDT